MKTVICTALLAFSLGLGSAFAQAPAPADLERRPRATPVRRRSPRPVPIRRTPRACMEKTRKKFRSECKKNGGKAQ